MEFIIDLLRRLHDDRRVDLPAAASAAYEKTLHPFHGWITSSVFTLAMKVCCGQWPVSNHTSTCTPSHTGAVRARRSFTPCHERQLGLTCLSESVHKRWPSDCARHAPRRWKGWLISASPAQQANACPAQVAPSRETFLGKLVPSPGSDVMDEIGTCTAAFSPTLAAVQKYLAEHGLDDPTKV